MFSGSRVSVLQDEKSSGDWWHNNVNGLNATEHLKMVKSVNFMLWGVFIF